MHSETYYLLYCLAPLSFSYGNGEPSGSVSEGEFHSAGGTLSWKVYTYLVLIKHRGLTWCIHLLFPLLKKKPRGKADPDSAMLQLVQTLQLFPAT